MSAPPSFQELTAEIRAFSSARDWERYHTPKNLAMAIASEAGELLHLYRWEDGLERRLFVDAERAEIADVLIFTLRLCDVLEIDPGEAILDKLDANARKYPAGEAMP